MVITLWKDSFDHNEQKLNVIVARFLDSLALTFEVVTDAKVPWGVQPQDLLLPKIRDAKLEADPGHKCRFCKKTLSGGEVGWCTKKGTQF